LKSKQLAKIVFLAQGAGAIFYAVFLASYALALPSNQVLHDQPVFKIPISIFGAIFIVSTVVLLLFSFIAKPEEETLQVS
jgi:TRAP-type C4-dicarboxylate transport system permease small subunit